MKRINVVMLPALVWAGLIFINSSPAQTAYTVVERGADYRVLQRTTVVNGTNQVHKYTELATGMNYTNAYGQLTESKEQITILPQGGASATQGRHQVYFPADIYNGVLEVVTPDGRHLSSRPLAVSYDDGSNTVFIATLTNSVGWLTASNQVTYKNCFSGIKADLVCTYRRGGFECDLVFRDQPPAPDIFGLDATFTTLQLITEFFNTQDPQQIPAASDEWFGLQDETLKFGKMTMKQGKAFAIGTVNSQSSAAVYKNWLHLSGRTFLVEQVPLVYVADDLQKLPLTSSIQKPETGSRMFASNHRQFPPAHGVSECTNQILIASADFSKQPGVVLDYNEVNSGQSDFTFESGQTYLIGGDDFALGGQTVFEGGAVIKINAVGWDSGIYPCVDIYDTAVFPPSADNPAIFTSMNDDSVGEEIDGSTGSPSFLDSEYSFMAEHDMTVSNMCFSYALFAINTPYNIDLWNCQFAHIDMAVEDAHMVGLHNVLICHGTTNMDDVPSGDAAIYGWGDLIAENVTLDDFPGGLLESGNAAYVTNCLFTSGSWVSTNGGGSWLNSVQPIYQTAANANYYLVTNSPYRNAGTTNIDPELLAELRTMTTYAPQDGGFLDTNAPDLGYHYPVNEDSDYDGIPDWWIWKYFGSYAYCGTNLDSSGRSLLYDYQYGIDPNVIQFSARLGNQHFNTTNATGNYLVLGGVPSYEAVLVNGTNVSAAVWTNYDGIVRMNLGSTDGVYRVWLGLKGFATNAQATWIGTEVYLDRVAPKVIITNPSTNTVAIPLIQLQGCAPEELQGVTFDVSNAVSMVTNRTGFLTGHYLDTNLLAFTTNYFQCYDILLTNGMNTVTIHATDLAGNVTATNFSFTLDYSIATNPVIQLTWPQDGMKVCGDKFTLRGWTDDPTAFVLASITDTNGNVAEIIGLVERNGNLWVENMPLVEGTNYLALTVTNASGYSSATNIVLVKSDITFALTGISGDLWNSTVNVSGNISDTNTPVWVNGVQGTNYGNGTWGATNVPVTSGGVATFIFSTSPPGPDDDAGITNVYKNPEIVMESAIWGSHSLANVDAGFGGAWERIDGSGNYTHTNGGSFTHHFVALDTNGATNYSATTVDTIATNLAITMEHSEDSLGHNTNRYNIGSFTIAQEAGLLNLVTNLGQVKELREFSTVHMMLHTGGKSMSNQNNLFQLTATATERVVGLPYNIIVDGPGVPSTTISVAGYTLDTNGIAWAVFPDGQSIDVPLDAHRPLYNFTVGQTKYTLTHCTACSAPDGTPDDRTTIGIGEVVHLSGMPGNTVWSLLGDGIITSTNGSAIDYIAPLHKVNATVYATVETAQPLSVPLDIIPPSSINAWVYTNKPLGQEYSNGNGMGAETDYNFIIGPFNVSFANVLFRENTNPTSMIVSWPNGTNSTIHFRRTDIPTPSCSGYTIYTDFIKTDAYLTNFLFSGTTYADNSFTSSWTNQYVNDTGDWTDFYKMTVQYDFLASDFKCKITYLGVPGRPQGPYFISP